MPNGDPSVDQALGSISLAADTIPEHDTAKIDYGVEAAAEARQAGPESSAGSRAAPRANARQAAIDRVFHALRLLLQALQDLFTGRGSQTPTDVPVKPLTEEGFYLLATYCFDLERKMEYIYRSTHAFALKGDPALAKELLNDERTINVPGVTWKQRSMLAEARLRALYRQIGPEHMRLLEEVARRGTGGPPPNG
jgi:hypothetical protein